MVQALVERRLIDKLVFYSPQTFDVAAKRMLVSEAANALELGGSPDDVSNQFFNELSKRSRLQLPTWCHQLILLQGAGAVGVPEGWVHALHEHGHRRVLRAGAVAGSA